MKKATAQKSKNSKKRENKEVTRVDSEPTAKKTRADIIDSVLLSLCFVTQGTQKQLEQDDKEIEYLEKKLGLNTSDSKSKKEIRRRLNKELKDDGFGDDIFDFLDQLDHVMEAPDMNKIKKELSQDEIDSLEKSRKKKAKKNAKVDLKQVEEGGDEEEDH